MRIKYLSLAIACLLSSAQAVVAQAPQAAVYGELDKTYAPEFDGNIFGMVSLPGGKNIFVGAITRACQTNIGRITRLNPDGTVDSSFNPGGVGADETIFDIALLPNGKLLIAGRFKNYNGEEANGIIRLMPDGTADKGFKPCPKLGGEESSIRKILLCPDGRYYAAGTFSHIGKDAIADIARFLPDGSLDKAFNPGGVGASKPGKINDAILLADGRILLGGSFYAFNEKPAKGSICLQETGSIDEVFSAKIMSNGFIRSLRHMNDNRILVTGDFQTFNSVPAYAAVILLADGSMDNSFSAYNYGDADDRILWSSTVAGDCIYLGMGAGGLAAVTPSLDCIDMRGQRDNRVNFGTGTTPTRDVLFVKALPEGRLYISGTFREYNQEHVNYFFRVSIPGFKDTAVEEIPSANPDDSMNAYIYEGRLTIRSPRGTRGTVYSVDGRRLASVTCLEETDTIALPGEPEMCVVYLQHASGTRTVKVKMY